MPYCPKCRYEYVPSVKTCPECGGPLVPEPPAEAEDAAINEPLVAVYEAPTEVMSIMVRDLLEDAGIPTVVQPGRVVSGWDHLDLSLRGWDSRLLVFESQADEARELIATYLADIESGAVEQGPLQEGEESDEG